MGHLNVPDGWQLVPKVPTQEMLDAAEKVEWADSDVRTNCLKQWYFMLAAAHQIERQQTSTTKRRNADSPPLPTESYVSENGLWEQRVVLNEESVREWGRAVERAAYEAAIKACEARVARFDEIRNEWARGLVVGSHNCANDIRALMQGRA